jgi:alpha/beta superfamily hydrolase
MELKLVNRKGLKIVGDLETPQGEIKGTAVVMHGWGSHRKKSIVVMLKDSFLDSGFQVFNFDATNSFGESGGEFSNSTLGTFAADMESVAKWVKKQEWFVPPLALSGHSKGGFAALNFAQRYPDEVQLSVALMPVVSGELSFEAAQKKDPEAFAKWKRDGVQTKVTSSGQVRVEYWTQMEERLNHTLLSDVRHIKIPVLLIAASLDESCPTEHIQKLYDQLENEKKKMVVLEDTPHSSLSVEKLAECKKIIESWLKTI